MGESFGIGLKLRSSSVRSEMLVAPGFDVSSVERFQPGEIGREEKSSASNIEKMKCHISDGIELKLMILKYDYSELSAKMRLQKS
jgi:hypothetical protein